MKSAPTTEKRKKETKQQKQSYDMCQMQSSFDSMLLINYSKFAFVSAFYIQTHTQSI